MWAKYFPGLAPDSLKRLFVLRGTYSDGGAPECGVLASNTEGPGSSSSITLFNPLNGDTTASNKLSQGVRHAMLLPDSDAQHRRVLMIVDRAHGVHVYPDTP